MRDAAAAQFCETLMAMSGARIVLTRQPNPYAGLVPRRVEDPLLHRGERLDHCNQFLLAFAGKEPDPKLTPARAAQVIRETMQANKSDEADEDAAAALLARFVSEHAEGDD